MLNIDPVVRVEVNVGTSTASVGVFDIGAIIGSTAVVGKFDASNRYYVCDSLAKMASDGFLTTSDEYKAAAKYFNVSPAPQSLVLIYCFAHQSDPSQNESPVVAMLDAMEKGAEFYGVYYIPATNEADPNSRMINLAAAMEEMNHGTLFYGVTGVVDTVTGSSALFALMKASAGNKRAVGMYCTTEVDDAAGLMGAAMGLSRVHVDDAFALCYKNVASATVNNITESDVNKIKGVNGNVYIERTRGRYFVENGSTASGLRFDDVLYIDRIATDIQNVIYEMIANSATKLPQTDSTTAQFLNAIYTVLEGYYNMGVLATNVWRGNAVEGKLEVGDYVEHGHAEFADSFDYQSEADRAAHKAMPITVLLCLSGSVESIEINVNVQT